MANLAGVDWNLFLVLHTVLEEGSATKAAKRLHVTQSAVSNALARLRVVLGDPLVVRIGNQLVPTAKARALAPRIAQVVAQLGQVLEPEASFDPKTSTRRFTIGCHADIELVLVPRLVELAAKRLPRASLRLAGQSAAEAAQALSTGELDALVGAVSAVPAGCVAEELYEDDVVVVVRDAHPLKAQSALGAFSRVSVHPAGDAEDALVVTSFVAAGLALSQSDSVLLAPRRIAAFLQRTFGLRIVEPEAPLDPVSVSLIWHARTDGDPAAQALREVLRETVRIPRRRAR